MWLFKTGEPAGNQRPWLDSPLPKDMLFAAPTPADAGRWAAYMGMRNHRIVAIEVTCAYHRYVHPRYKGFKDSWRYADIRMNRVRPAKVEFGPRGAEISPWDGQLSSLLDGEDGPMPLREVLYYHRNVVCTRRLTEAERREYDAGYRQMEEAMRENWQKARQFSIMLPFLLMGIIRLPGRENRRPTILRKQRDREFRREVSEL